MKTWDISLKANGLWNKAQSNKTPELASQAGLFLSYNQQFNCHGTKSCTLSLFNEIRKELLYFIPSFHSSCQTLSEQTWMACYKKLYQAQDEIMINSSPSDRVVLKVILPSDLSFGCQIQSGTCLNISVPWSIHCNCHFKANIQVANHSILLNFTVATYYCFCGFQKARFSIQQPCNSI